MNLFNRVKELKESGITWSEIAKTVANVRQFENGEALRSWYRRERVKESTDDVKFYVDSKMPAALPTPFESILQLKLERDEVALVVSDVHVPYHQEELLESIISKVNILDNLKAIIIAGDLFTFDQISKYSKAHNIPRMETELEIGGSVLLYLSKYAPLYITNSNHDARFANKIDAQFSLKRLMNAALNGRTPENQINTTERDYMFVNDDFIIGHLSSATGSAGKIAHNIAQKYQRHCLAGHDHITGVFNPRSKYVGASIGCVADYKKFWYSEKGMNPAKFMQNGYALISGSSDIKLFNDKYMYFHRWYDEATYSTCVTDLKTT